MEHENKRKNRSVLLIALYIVSAIFFLSFTILSVVNRNWCAFDKPIEMGTWGAYGDFVGGLIGTIFSFASIIILRKTLVQQQDESYENQKVLTLDRFNAIFFELLKLYHQHLEIIKDPTLFMRSYGRDLLDEKKRELQRDFKAVPQDKWNRKNALEIYNEKFYSVCGSSLFMCFSTLYRIYGLIEDSKISEKYKRDYSKIIRSQLSAQELFFLRYNAGSFFGLNFVSYINKYNVLKHLPTFELLEFKKWWGTMNDRDRMLLNRLFFEIKKKMRMLHKEKDARDESVFKDLILLRYEKNAFFLKFKMSRCKNFPGLKKLKISEVTSLFAYFLKEVYVWSFFSELYKIEELEYSSYDDPSDSLYRVCRVRTKGDDVPLYLDYNEKNKKT